MLTGTRNVQIVLQAGEARAVLVRGSLDWGDGTHYTFTLADLTALLSPEGLVCAHRFSCREEPYLLACLVEDAEGAQGTCHLAIQVQNTPPHLALAIIVQAQQVTVTPAATDPDGTIQEIVIAWDTDPAHTTCVDNGTPAAFIYPDEMRRPRIRVTARDDEGAIVQATVEVRLDPITAAALPWGQSPGARSHERAERGEASA
ncbi:MAG: hypothetical protein ACYDBB_08600 [Armatimonadota bacterium]